MDSEHRHELAENDLARILGGYREKVGSYLGPIVAGAIAVVAILVGTAIVRGQSAAATQQAWQELSSANVADSFAEVAENYPGTEVAAWARVNEGRLFLREGIRESFQDRDAATKSLQSAKTAFTAALESPVAPPEARERALFGLATYEESVSGKDTKAAVAAYKKLIDEFPEAASRQYAESRIKVLESEAGQEFYAWFSEQNPQREEASSPLDGFNLDSMTQPPAAIEGLPSATTPDETTPDETTSDETTSDEAAAATDGPAPDDAEMKKPDSTTSTDSAKKPETAGDEKPAPSEEKPATESPASEKPVEKAEAKEETTKEDNAAEKTEKPADE